MNILFENEFIEIASVSEIDSGYAKAKSEYIPIESFKEAFTTAYELAKENNWQKFIFDKSNLTVFHQPSMEWYYTDWKNKLVEIGLTEHYKILPKESWFKSSVEAGISEIKEKHPDFDFNRFTVSYINSIDELLED